MTEENIRDSLPRPDAAGAPQNDNPAPSLPREPEEVVCYYAAPVDKPVEVVCRYVRPAPGTGAAVRPETDPAWYQPDTAPAELPGPGAERGESGVSVWREAAQKEKRRRRRNRWIVLGSLTAVAALLVGGLLWANRKQGAPSNLPQDGDSASSIVDIFGGSETVIPRVKGDSAVRLKVNPQRGPELTAAALYEKVNPSVVTVVAEQRTGASVGTGVIMTADGYVITNAHVISGGKSCWIALDTGVTYDVRLVGYDEEEDLAVLKAVDARDLPAAEFGDSEQMVVGEKAYAIGNPLGVELRGTLTDGIISAVNRQIEVDGGTMTMLQTTAALNNGNSGGPLINASGQVVGINTIKMSASGWAGEATVEGLGFALPISSACFVINDLIASGRFQGVPTIGITVVTAQDGQGGTQVQVYSVEEDYGAADAGVREGDVILLADGQTIAQTADLLAVRRTHVIGDTIELTILRDGETIQVPVVLYSSKGR